MYKKILLVCLVLVALGILGGCASYQGAVLTPEKYDKDGKPASGGYDVQSVFKF